MKIVGVNFAQLFLGEKNARITIKYQISLPVCNITLVYAQNSIEEKGMHTNTKLNSRKPASIKNE